MFWLAGVSQVRVHCGTRGSVIVRSRRALGVGQPQGLSNPNSLRFIGSVQELRRVKQTSSQPGSHVRSSVCERVPTLTPVENFHIWFYGRRNPNINVQAMGTFSVKHLEWVTHSELKSERFLKVKVHDFCLMMLRNMEACNVFDNLYRLFDANRVNSTTPATNSQASPAAGSEETVLASTQFDVVSALGTAACAARPEAPPLPPKPSWSQLVTLKGQLH
eukprot:452338-Rhodomonas_salina.2